MKTSIGYTKEQMAQHVADELQEDWVVNVGIGLPLTILPYVPVDKDIIFHSENGIIGMGPELADPAQGDNDLLSAGKRPVSLIPGASFVNHADSFVVVRGGRLDATILGAYQVAENGDLANWKLPGKRLGSMGGAMDIAVGAKRVLIMMTHVTSDGRPKIVKTLSYPATARNCVTKIFTDRAIISVTQRGLVLERLAPGSSVEDVQAMTEPALIISEKLKSS
ncbi:MAG: 3-oxoacid CoA-transferase subunit B [Betaproteobacteria bacterium]|nr:3-oxoacid CoA-transferase subunit B [Betaproteobacteria bacterium]